MCGVLGWWNISGKTIDANSIHRLTDRIAHRGPDDEGYLFVNRKAGLVSQFCGNCSPLEIKKEMPHIEQAEDWARENQADLAISHRRFSIFFPMCRVPHNHPDQ